MLFKLFKSNDLLNSEKQQQQTNLWHSSVCTLANPTEFREC